MGRHPVGLDGSAKRGHPRFAAACAVVLACTCGVFTVESQNATPPAAARERLLLRVDAFWKAWQEGNLFAIFQLYAPSYRRKTSEAAFYELTRGMLGIQPIDYTVGDITWADEGRRAVITLNAHTNIQPVGIVPNRLVQQWVYEEGDWYRARIVPEVIPKPPSSVTVPPPSAPR